MGSYWGANRRADGEQEQGKRKFPSRAGAAVHAVRRGGRLAAAAIVLLALLAMLPAAAYAQAGNDDLGKDASTEINVKNADIAAIVKIFSRKTKRNYILDENVKGKVSIYLPGKVSAEESIRILDAVLALKGFTSVPIGENLWKIIPAREAKGTTIPTSVGPSGDLTTAAVVTRLINLKFVAAEEVQQLLGQLISPYGLITAYGGTNALIVVDSEDNIERLTKIIDALDVPFSNREMTIIPVTHAAAADIADKLNQILGEPSQSASGTPGGLEAVRARIRQAAAARGLPGQPPPVPDQLGGQMPPGQGLLNTTVGARSREPKIIADERTNSIIVLADEDSTARIRALIAQLDSPIDLSGNRFYVYRCQHANADELAQVLSGLAGGGGGGGGSTTPRTGGTLGTQTGPEGGAGGLGFGSTANRTGRQGTQDRLASQRRLPGQPSQQGGRGAPTSVNLAEGVSITADPATNSLIIVASKADYLKLLELIKELDIKRRQVLVEAMLLEVGVDDTTSLGTEFLGSAGTDDGGMMVANNNGGLTGLLSDPTKITGFSVAAASAGTLTLPNDIQIPTQTILLTAAKTNSRVNVLSAPNVLTADNEKARIVVGQNVPFLASTSTSETNLNNVFNQIDRQDVGITLELTPHISQGDFVTLSVFTEVSNVVGSTATSTLGPTTTVRTSETTVIAKDGQMVVIGGLMSDNISDTNSGVPFLSDIPVLGHFFRRNSEDFRRTNLLIFITPHIVRDQFDARDLTIAKRDHLEDVIAYEEIYPERREILENPGIDRVAESSHFEGVKPSTIRPLVKRPAPPAEVPGGEEPIELKIAPELPGPAGGSAAPAAEEPAAPQAQLRLAPAAASAGTERFYVMALKHPKRAGKNFPFRTADNGYFGVVLPADSSSSAQDFFVVGGTYGYQLQTQQLEVIPLGMFHSQEEASQLYDTLQGNWYTLSPYEIMNLGKGPWQRLS